jgi:hypothetical protein
MGRNKIYSTPSLIESDGLFITKPFDVLLMMQKMPTMDSEPSYSCIKNE